MNSMLWELCDGSRTFGEVCNMMNDVFQENIAPVLQRTAAAIGLLQSKNSCSCWMNLSTVDGTSAPAVCIGPSRTSPKPDYDYDCSPVEGDAD